MEEKNRDIVIHKPSDEKSYMKKNVIDLIIYILVITISMSIMKFFELSVQGFSKDRQRKTK